MIRSWCCCDSGVNAVVGGATDCGADRFGGWNDGGGWRVGHQRVGVYGGEKKGGELALTVARVPPESTRSLVAATLPPLRCRSQAMARRSSWGNIWASCSTAARSMALPRVEREEELGYAAGMLVEGFDDGCEKSGGLEYGMLDGVR
jgi:hypothetical protein